MDWQFALTALLVPGCALYAAWRLMPAAWRGRGRAWLGIAAPTAAGACGDGCKGCGANDVKTARQARPAAGPQTIHVVRRARAP